MRVGARDLGFVRRTADRVESSVEEQDQVTAPLASSLFSLFSLAETTAKRTVEEQATLLPSSLAVAKQRAHRRQR